MSSNTLALVSGLSVTIISLLLGQYFWSALGLGMSVYFLLDTIENIGKSIPIIHFIVLMMLLQWVVGPIIEYSNEHSHYKYYMYVEEPIYMSFIVPAIIAFLIGTHIFSSKENLDDIGDKVQHLVAHYPKLPYIMIIMGFLSPLISRSVPSSIGFVFHILGGLKYIGVIYLLFKKGPNRWLLFVGVLLSTLLASLAVGMFHDFLLWSILMSTFTVRELRLNRPLKFTLAIIGFFTAVSIQSVKGEYREALNNGYSGNNFLLFASMIQEKWESGSVFGGHEKGEAMMTVRLNQGWIISATMAHVPQREPFANGSTIIEGIETSLLPRIIAPNKAKAGGRENFRKYTGLQIGEHTSMGISIAGEAWVNFGYWGGIFFMLAWGLFISWFWNKIHTLSEFYPTILIWSPLLFLQVIKAETEFMVVLNHLIKASALVFGLLWFIKRQWGVRI